MRLIRGLLILSLLLLSFDAFAKKKICISCQKDYDSLQDNLIASINGGEKDIFVYFKQGEYVVSGGGIELNRIKAPQTSIHFIGEGDVSIVPRSRVYQNGDLYDGGFNINSTWMSGKQDLNVWSHVKYADGNVEVLDEEQKNCRIKARKPIKNVAECKDSYILIPAWYRSFIYKIDRIAGGYIYFTANNLKKSYRNGYNVNDDYNYGGKNIRYKLCNVEDGEQTVKIIKGRVVLPDGIEMAREGISIRALAIRNSKFDTIEIKGISFNGASYGKYSSLFGFENATCKQMLIHNCSFYGIKSYVMDLTSTENVSVRNNTFKDCYNHGILSDNRSANTVVTDNSFSSMGKMMLASFCVACAGKDYYVSGNTFTDFGYGAIEVGESYSHKLQNPSCGIVENNEMSYSDEYLADIDNYSIMDGGAIYVGTQNTGAIIRYNTISNYTGMTDNRGIFCDDGTYGVQIYGNLITGITNSYSIDCRRVKNVEESKYPDSGIKRANINIVIRDNVVDAPIRFEGHEDADNCCYKGCNIILRNGLVTSRKTIYRNVEQGADDVTINSMSVRNKVVEVTRADYQRLRRLSNWGQIKRMVKKIH